MLSLAKVEKVVKPPQMPVVRSRYQGLDIELYLLKRANKRPKTRHPRRLTVSVPHGKPCPHTFLIIVEMKYLNDPPRKLPIPTNNIDFIMARISLVRIGINRNHRLFIRPTGKKEKRIRCAPDTRPFDASDMIEIRCSESK